MSFTAPESNAATNTVTGTTENTASDTAVSVGATIPTDQSSATISQGTNIYSAPGVNGDMGMNMGMPGAPAPVYNNQYSTPYMQPNVANGQGYNNYYGQPAVKESENGMCMAGFIISIIGLFIPFLVPVVGLILSIIGFKQTKEGKRSGYGFGLAGIIISSIILGITLLAILMIIAIVASL